MKQPIRIGQNITDKLLASANHKAIETWSLDFALGCWYQAIKENEKLK